MANHDRTKEVRGQAPRKEEIRQKKISADSTNSSNEDRTKEVRGQAPRKEEIRQKKISAE
jgi:hypothetical protein